MKNILWIIALIVLVILLGGLGYGYYKTTEEVKNPIVTMEIENYGSVKIELYPELAPESVKNFVNLINNGYYNGLTFHRVVKDFMIQGGDIIGDGTGTVSKGNILGTDDVTPYTVKGEFFANGVENDLKFEEGVIGMARSDYSQMSSELLEESYNSAGSQFFIVTGEATSLNGYYTSFGKVIEGMDIINKIEEVEVKVADDAEETGNTEQSIPVETIKITNMTVDTMGIEYELPTLLEAFDYNTWLYEYYGLSF